MASLEDIRAGRLKKLELLRAKGIDPYPASCRRDASVAEVSGNFEYFAGKGSIALAGRIMSLRPQGGITFLNFTDGTGIFQALLREGDTPDDARALFAETVDIGDFVSFVGELFISKRGEKTILVKEWAMAAKSLLPLPEKWHGIQDPEERYRLRYLDLLMNPELRAMFERKARFWGATRSYLKTRGFLEVETPTLEVTTGGAEARPFRTHHNDYDLDVYLRISVGELWQKRLMAGGFPRTFEIGRLYRNEGTSPEHLQEFTNLEFYAAYMDYREGMKFTEDMIKSVAEEAFGGLRFKIKGADVDLGVEWPKIEYVPTIKTMTGIDVQKASEDEIKGALRRLGVEYEGKTRERLTDSLWKHCRKQIMGPAWLIDLPKLVSPLSKSKPEDPSLVERAQLIIGGAEMTNGFSELNDPIDQGERFALQQKLIEAGDEEAMMPDHEFVEMLEHGMPPTFGFAYGDRLFSTLEGKPVRETQLFPLLRPRIAGGHEKKAE